ncbi:MAG: TolC family protein, partial [Myxococcota bacterium]
GARPELDRQERSVDRARAGVAIARSGALPTVSVQGSAQVGAAASGGGPSTELPTFDLVVPAPTFESADLGRPVPSATVGLVLTWNPFDLLRTRQLVRQAELELERTEAANASERNRLLAEIRSAQAEVEALRARFPLVHQQLQLARDNQGIVQDLYAQGSASILDLFNAQAAFRASAIQEAALAVALATAELDLRWLLGDDLLSGVSR